MNALQREIAIQARNGATLDDLIEFAAKHRHLEKEPARGSNPERSSSHPIPRPDGAQPSGH